MLNTQKPEPAASGNGSTLDLLRLVNERLEYDHITGIFTTKRFTRADGRTYHRKGQAGCLTPDGYVTLGIDGKIYYAHRIALLLKNGRLPPEYSDHINGIGHDNRWVNLREATAEQNATNRRRSIVNTSGEVGITIRNYGVTIKYEVTVYVYRRYVYVGAFASMREAIEMRRAAEVAYYGENAPVRELAA